MTEITEKLRHKFTELLLAQSRERKLSEDEKEVLKELIALKKDNH